MEFFYEREFPSSMAKLARTMASIELGQSTVDRGMTNGASRPSSYLCPGSKTEPGPLRNVDQWMDYIYIYWPKGRDKTPADYPLMYDRRLSNHGGKGINVATVGKKVFWDRGAKWLQRFAEEHPDLKVALPEDLRREPTPGNRVTRDKAEP